MKILPSICLILRSYNFKRQSELLIRRQISVSDYLNHVGVYINRKFILPHIK